MKQSYLAGINVSFKNHKGATVSLAYSCCWPEEPQIGGGLSTLSHGKDQPLTLKDL